MRGQADKDGDLVGKRMRLFKKKQKIAAALFQDVTLDGREADHIRPVAFGGQTTVENCQLLGTNTNRKKGSEFKELRKWQTQFIRVWDQRPDGQPFLLVAIPGGGKTHAALVVAANWLRAGPDRRIVIVVPTDNLRSQWQEEAVKLGIELQTKEFGTDFKQGFLGAVTTYQAVATSHLIYRKLCSISPTMVIFDEIHHCGDSASFGAGVKEAFGLAREKLLLSGTPWKTSGEAIPFIRYDGDGFPVPDFRYDYPDALNDDVVRWLSFFHDKGTIEFVETGRREEFHSEISEDDASKRLKKLLQAGGDYVRRQIRSAHQKLLECRRTFRDAAALAACIDKEHADQIAKVIREETGCDPSVIVSDDDLANDSVKRFRGCSKEWLVAVRQVSEGTDIKRLQVLCYLTTYATEVFFRQIIGRVSRRRGDDDFEAYVYLPADPRLVKFSKNIENAQMIAVHSPSEHEPKERTRPEDEDVFFESYTTRHSGRDVTLIGNIEYPADIARKIEAYATEFCISMEKVARLWHRFLTDEPLPMPENQPPPSAPLEERMDRLRRECNSKAFLLSKLMNVEVKEIHKGFSRQEQMNEKQLEQKLANLKQRIRNVRR